MCDEANKFLEEEASSLLSVLSENVISRQYILVEVSSVELPQLGKETLWSKDFYIFPIVVYPVNTL